MDTYIACTEFESNLNIGFVGDILRVTATKGVDMKNTIASNSMLFKKIIHDYPLSPIRLFKHFLSFQPNRNGSYYERFLSDQRKNLYS